jgi:hypothetical protein
MQQVETKNKTIIKKNQIEFFLEECTHGSSRK